MSQLFTSAGQRIGASGSDLSPSSEYSGLISFRIDWFDVLAVQETLESLFQHHSSKASTLWHSALSTVQFSQFRTEPDVRAQHPGSSTGSAPVGRGPLISLPHLSEPQFLPTVKGSDPCTTVRVRVPTQGGVGTGVCVRADKPLRTSGAALSLHMELLKLDFRCVRVENPHPNVQAVRRDHRPPTPCSSPR